MDIRTVVILLGLGLAASVQADAPGRVWVYQPDGGSYRIENRSYQYDPRSPYSQHRQYRQNLPPRYQGQLPPQYYDRHRGLDRPQRWGNDARHGLNRPQRWQHDHRPRAYQRSPGLNERRGFGSQPHRGIDRGGYRRH